MGHHYTPPANKLLTYGDCREFDGWPDYLALGFSQEHVPELIKMAGDEELLWAMSDTLEVWAPIHAWRTLGQLRAETAIPVLLANFSLVEDNDDWAGDDIPSALALIGMKAIPAVEAYINDEENGIIARIAATMTFLKLFREGSQCRKETVAALMRCLEKYRDNDPELNANLISHAIDMGAKETLPSIRLAFEAGQVDYSMSGDLEDVEIRLGVRKERSTPPPDVFKAFRQQTHDTHAFKDNR